MLRNISSQYVEHVRKKQFSVQCSGDLKTVDSKTAVAVTVRSVGHACSVSAARAHGFAQSVQHFSVLLE